MTGNGTTEPLLGDALGSTNQPATGHSRCSLLGDGFSLYEPLDRCGEDGLMLESVRAGPTHLHFGSELVTVQLSEAGSGEWTQISAWRAALLSAPLPVDGVFLRGTVVAVTPCWCHSVAVANTQCYRMYTKRQFRESAEWVASTRCVRSKPRTLKATLKSCAGTEYW